MFGTNYHPDGFLLAFLEPEKSIVGALFGLGNKIVPSGLANIIHKILVADSNFRDIKWFTENEFNHGEYADGAKSPLIS